MNISGKGNRMIILSHSMIALSSKEEYGFDIELHRRLKVNLFLLALNPPTSVSK